MPAEDYIFPQCFLDPGLQGWVDECHQLYPGWFYLVDDLNVFAIEVVTSLNAHSGELQEVLIATMFIRALHTFQGAVLMAERGMITPGRMLARCMLEVIFLLVAISKDKAFASKELGEDNGDALYIFTFSNIFNTKLSASICVNPP